MIDLGAHAEAYYTMGLIPIKVKKGSKAPSGGKGWQNPNYRDQQDVYDQFKDWDGGIGLLLGKCNRGFLIDIDLDDDLTRTIAAYTMPAGFGWYGRNNVRGATHYLYLFDQEVPTKKYLGPGGKMLMERRGQGLQSLVPPSVHPSGAPLVWIGQKFEMSDVSDTLERVGLTAGLGYIANVWPEQGSRQYLTLALTGFLLNHYTVDVVELAMLGLLVALDENTAERREAVNGTVKKFQKGEKVTGGPTIASIVGDEAYGRFIDYLALPDPPQLGLDDMEDEDDETRVVSSLVSIYDLVTKQPFTQDEVVEGLIWSGKTHWLYSDPNAGKTMLALAIALHIAAGIDFAGRVVRQGPVVIIEEDSSLAVIASYLDNFASLYNIDFRNLPVYFNEEQGIRIYKPRDIDRVHELVHSTGTTPSLVIFDSCERILPSNTFNSREVDPLDRLLKSLANQGIANLVLDHTNKSQYDNPTDMDVLYGSRAKSAIADIMVQLQGSVKLGALNATFTKFRGDTPPSFDIYYNGDEGFRLVDRPGATKTGYEGEIIGWFMAQGRRWIDEVRIEEALLPVGQEDDTMAVRRLHRTLASLGSRRLLRRQTDLEGINLYKLNV